MAASITAVVVVAVVGVGAVGGVRAVAIRGVLLFFGFGWARARRASRVQRDQMPALSMGGLALAKERLAFTIERGLLFFVWLLFRDETNAAWLLRAWRQ
jgi:hypothetical protein